jgi:hypothetical protein
MIPRPSLSNVPAAGDSALGSAPNVAGGNVSASVAINVNDDDELSEGVSDGRQVKKNIGTRRKINFKEEALHSVKRKIKLMEKRLMKKCKSYEDEGCKFLMSLLPSTKNWTTFKEGNLEWNF